jgi:hypothetical protein
MAQEFIADEAAWPQVLHEFLLGDDAVALLQEVDQHPKHLRLNRA